MAYTIHVTLNRAHTDNLINSILVATSEIGTLKLNIEGVVVIYNDKYISFHDIIWGNPDMDLLYHLCAVRKAVFENITLKDDYSSLLKSLREMTRSCIVPGHITIKT